MTVTNPSDDDGMTSFEKVPLSETEGEMPERQILADTRGMAPEASEPVVLTKPEPEPVPEPGPEPQPTAPSTEPVVLPPEPPPELGAPPAQISAAHEAMKEAAAVETGTKPKGPLLRINGLGYQCRPKPPGHVSATIAKLTGIIASSTMGKAGPAGAMERAKTDPAFLEIISSSTGDLYGTAQSLVIEAQREALDRRWRGDCPEEEVITDAELLPALMDVMAAYARQTAPLR